MNPEFKWNTVQKVIFHIKSHLKLFHGGGGALGPEKYGYVRELL